MSIDPATISSALSLLPIIEKFIPEKEKPDFLRLKEYILSLESTNLSNQKEIIEFQEKISELEDKIKKYNDWETEKLEYEPVRLETQVIVYKRKDGSDDFMYCPTCFIANKLAIHLQPVGWAPEHCKCHKCQSDFIVKKQEDIPTSPNSIY